MKLIVFYFAICYFITAHMTTSIEWIALLVGALYLLLNQLQKRWPVVLFGSIYCFVTVFNFDLFQNELRLLFNEFIEAMNKLGIVLPLQETSANSATFAMCFIFFVLAVCLNEKSWSYVLVITLCLPFLLQASFNLLALFVLFASSLFIKMMKNTFQFLYFAPLTIIILATFPFENLPLFSQVGHQIEQTKLAIQYNADHEAQLTNGDFNKIHNVSQSDEPAFRIAMESPRPIYLKSFVGAHFENGWLPNSLNAPKNVDITTHLMQQNYFESTQLAQASQKSEQTVSIEHIQLSKAIALAPYELAAPIEGFTFKQNRWESNHLFGQSSYTYAISETAYFEYPQVAEKIYTSPEPAYKKTEAITNYLNYDAYTAISDADRVILSNHFGPADQHSLEETIQAVQSSMNILTYDEAATKLKGDFLQALLEESKVGHAIHYATLATVLFRYYGVPARYVEGYIITNEDLKNAVGRNELTIPFKNQHAWTEIYIDKIGWIPIEVTPGYHEKMPETVQSPFKQSTTTVAPNMQQQANEKQVKDDFIPEEPPVENKKIQSSWHWELILVGILLFLVAIIFYIMKHLNKVELAFKRFIRKTRNKENIELPLHRHIQTLNNEHAQAAYNLYNEIMYLQNGQYTKAQLKQLKQHLKLARKS